MIKDNKIKKNTIRLKAAIFLVFSLTVSLILVFSFMLMEDTALALVPTPAKFTKVSGTDSLTAVEWNELTLDFIDQLGDTMLGDLDMNGAGGPYTVTNLAAPTANSDAATKLYVDSTVAAATAGAVEDVDGGAMKMVCGMTQAGVDWANDGFGNCTIWVDTRSSVGVNNFVNPPFYIANIGGTLDHEMYTGTNSVYGTSVSGFRINIPTCSAAAAVAGSWYISWCGFGN